MLVYCLGFDLTDSLEQKREIKEEEMNRMCTQKDDGTGRNAILSKFTEEVLTEETL